MDDTSSSPISLWKLLRDRKIEIPIIQRDYAQGRNGYERLRERFLQTLQKALDAPEQPLILDFIYGQEKNGRFLPIDGQQRLTTLWLLHWFMAWKAGVLPEKANVLKNFSYETRISSRDFCQKLCTLAPPSSPATPDAKGAVSPAATIRKQTWFNAEWEQDPTVQGMLTLLDNGTEKYKDSLQSLFADYDKTQFADWWRLLESDRCPVQFCCLQMQDFGLSDDLYVKMNARGHFLTDFENLKSDLLSYAQKEEGMEWRELVKVEKSMSLPRLLDGEWTDFFWKYFSNEFPEDAEKNSDSDELFFAFINRFFLDFYILRIKDEKEEYYKHFVSDGDVIRYTSLEDYKYDDKIDIALLQNLRTVLNEFISLWDEGIDQKIYSAPWRTAKPFHFIPGYDEKGQLARLTLPERVAFHGMCKFLRENTRQDGWRERLKRWMRVVWNIASAYRADPKGEARSLIDGIGPAKEAIRFLDSLDSQDVYASLAKQSDSVSAREEKNNLSRKIYEEYLKGKQIAFTHFAHRSWAWEEKIIDAETYAFFEGTIPFLFRNDQGKVAWGNFDTKLATIKHGFQAPQTGTRKETADADRKCVVKNNDANLLRDFLHRLPEDKFGAIDGKCIYNNSADAWRYLLNNRDLLSPVHEFLLRKRHHPKIKFKDPNIRQCMLCLCKTRLLDLALQDDTLKDAWIHWRHGYAFYKPHNPHLGLVYLNAGYRNVLLHDREFVIDKDNLYPDVPLLKKDNVRFTFRGHRFECYGADKKIYLLSSPSDDYLRRTKSGEGETEFWEVPCPVPRMDHQRAIRPLRKIKKKLQRMIEAYQGSSSDTQMSQ